MMSEPDALMARSQGCDATHRANNSDTHLTHGCIQLFRQFSRVRKECAEKGDCLNPAIQPFFEGARRTLAEIAR